MSIRLSLGAIFILGASLTITAAITPPGEKLLVFVGSNTLGEHAVPELAKAYLEQKKKATDVKIVSNGELIHVTGTIPGTGPVYVEIHATGSGDSFKSFLGNSPRLKEPCDIGMSSRRVTNAEAEATMEKLGSDFLNRGKEPGTGSEHPVALDGLAIVVSPDNSLEKITVDDVRRVFLGEITNFSALGDPDRPIQLHARPERSGTYKFFSDAVLLGRSISGTAKRHAENTAVAESVVKDPNGIGFVPMTNAGSAKILKVGDSKASYSAPTEETVHRGAYPSALCRYVYFYVAAAEPQTPSVAARRNWPIAREFAAMSQTWRGQAIVESSGFIAETSTLDATVKVRRSQGEPLTDYLRRLGEIESKVRSGKLTLQPKLTEDEICPQLLFDFNEWTLTAFTAKMHRENIGVFRPTSRPDARNRMKFRPTSHLNARI